MSGWKLEPLVEVNCFKYFESCVAVDRRCERDVVQIMNGEYKVLNTEVCAV